jgi:predicted metal-dependent peptidase
MRRSRRFPHRADIKGVAKDRSFDLVVLVDISGSMSTEEILVGLNEIHEICKLTKTTMKLIQIDTKVHKVEEFSAKTKLFERSGCGGTVMEAGIDYLVDNKVPYDALVYISDMWIEDVREWKVQPHGRTLWLSTSDQIPEWNGWNKHTVIPLQVT